VSFDLAIDAEPEAATPEGDFPPGTVLVERYRVIQVLGRGGMGSVYLAEHIEVGRKVAIKVLLSQWSQTDSIVRRFRAEARTASAIGHPNIVQVFDAGILPDRRLFLVMEHLAGRDLEAELIELVALEPRRSCVIMRQIALALGAGHRAGIVHRDLKPSNIMLVPQPDGEAVKVLDFGIAANGGLIVGGAERITSPGSLMGTPEYMAPEQATNMPARPTFDVYAMGVMLFEMLSGDIPFSASNAFELLAFKLNRPAPSIETRRPDLPPSLVKLIADCLATDAAERPLDGDAVAARLDTVLHEMRRHSLALSHRLGTTPSGEPHPADTLGAAAAIAAASASLPPLKPTPGTTLAPLSRPASRKQTAVTLLLGLLAVGGLALAVWLLRAPPPEPPPELAAVVPPTPAPVAPPPVPKDTSPPTPPLVEPPPVEPAPEEPAPPPEGVGARPTVKAAARPGHDAHLTPRCQRVRTSAETARRSQRWAILRDYSRQRECWASASEARKLETKALMELGDFTGCMSVGKGLKDQEAQGWLKLCQKRVGG